MICKDCALAADTQMMQFHHNCKGCDCQHREGKLWVSKK